MLKSVSLRLLAVLTIVVLSVSQSSSQSANSPIPRVLSLAQAENILIERNLTVVAAKYQIDANRAARLIASYKPNPVVTIGAEQIPFYSPIANSVPRFFTTNPDAGANPVYTFRVDKIWERGGKRELRTTQAEEQLQASEAQMLDAIRTTVFQLRSAFNSAIQARENLKLAETSEKQYAQTEALTQVKVDQGDIAKVELYRAVAGRIQYQQAVLQARTTYNNAVHDVLNILGARQQEVAPMAAQNVAARLPDSLHDSSLELLGDFDDHPIPQSLEDLHSLALTNRPDVIAAQHLLASSASGTKLAAAQRTRDIDTGYEYQRVGNDHTAGVVIQFPLFVSNNQLSLLTQAEAQQHTAEAQLKQVEIQVHTDVDKAYESYLSARRVLELYNGENLSQVDKLRSIAVSSYGEGAISLFEVLDAQRAYSTAMTGYTQARADYQLALWTLEQAVGHSLK
jgi:cobalt-zinc-cadmium efflux system outer membrane protein